MVILSGVECNWIGQGIRLFFFFSLVEREGEERGGNGEEGEGVKKVS